ncbi:oxidoreductase (plasmid) [Mycobacterium sp. djl-10]|nr:oxidoreductase [Mycobacterium sp. djl-10]
MSVGALSGRVAVVTGAAGGIGSAIARALARQGAWVMGVDNAESVFQCMAEIGGVGLHADLSDPVSATTTVAAAAELRGRLDIVINAAGIQLRTAAVNVDELGWQRLLDVNLSAAYRLIRAAAPQLVAHRGCVVNVASLSADRAVPGIVPYGATKAALTHLSKGLAVELGPKGVRVNTVAPGYIETPMTSEVLNQSEFRTRALSRIPLQRFADGDDVADAVVFLCAPAARYITGIVLPVDGGYSIT